MFAFKKTPYFKTYKFDKLKNIYSRPEYVCHMHLGFIFSNPFPIFDRSVNFSLPLMHNWPPL